MYQITIEQASAAELLSGEFGDNAERILDSWQHIGALEIQQEMPCVETIDLGARAVGAVILEPYNGNYDEENVLTLGLPHKNGWSPQHYIRARILQQTVSPDSRLIVFPDNSFGQKVTHYTTEDKKRMAGGDSRPIAETQMSAIEKLAADLGVENIYASGYSKAARVAIALGAVGSDVINVQRINADETPSKNGRGLINLGRDFMISGTDVEQAAKNSEIPALAEIMSAGELKLDFLKFALANIDPRNLSDIKSMTGSISSVLEDAAGQIGGENIKLGFVAGSKLFDLSSISDSLKARVNLEQYVGNGFLGHASGDNAFLYAAMAYRGLRA